jgi:uncharacterized protein (TIGR02680 family)
MSFDRWMMNRAGLLNFWYYDDEIFTFSNGKLLLRGTNGSGKSVTMQSFIPVLLDGKKTPDRLDPFGSKARKMEDYLLGEKDVVDRDERTGYLFLEYKKQNTEQYLTTGIGMQAKRHKGIKSWYFLITDNRRIGIDFELAHTHGGDRVPLSAKELENRISTGGYVVHSQSEYMELVNRYVFGFQSIEAYEDLIKLLIQLRSPKLSKDFKPTVIYEILESALPPLTDDELRHLSDTIESLDQAKQQLDQLEREYESTKRLVKQYHAYNELMMYERAREWQFALKKRDDAESERNRLAKAIEQLTTDIEGLEKDKIRYRKQKELAKAESERLQNHEVWRLESEKTKIQERALELSKEIKALEAKWDQKKAQYRETQKACEREEDTLHQAEKSQQEILEELAYDAEDTAFSAHETNAQDYARLKEDDFDFSVWHKEVEDHDALLAMLKQLAEDADRLKAEHERLERQSSEKKRELDECRQELDHLKQWFNEQKQVLEENIFQWIKHHPELTIPQDRLQEVMRAMQGLYDTHRYDDVRGPLVDAINDYTAELKTKIRLKENEKRAKEEAIQAAEADLNYWRTLKIPQPERPEETERFRQELEEKATPYLPFYAAVEFQDHVTDEQKERLEAALKKTGILDSLITAESVIPQHDSVIGRKPRLLEPTLADFLRPDVDADSPVSSDVIDEVLRSIPLTPDDGLFHIDADGRYTIGCLSGHAPIEGSSKYIGRSSRKRYQKEKIDECLAQLEALRAEWEALHQEVIQLEAALEEADGLRQTLPSDKDLSDLFYQIESTTRRMKDLQETLTALDQEYKAVHQQFRLVRSELQAKGGHLNLTLTDEALGLAQKAFKHYRKNIHQLETATQVFRFAKRRLDDLRHRLREIEADLDEIKGNANIKTDQLSLAQLEVASIEKQLKLQGIDDVRRRIQDVQRALNEAEHQMEAINRTLPEKVTEKRNHEEKKALAEVKCRFWSRMADVWEKMVKAEATLGFIEIEAIEPEAILTQLRHAEKYDRAKVSEQLSKAFINEQQFLTEYRMFEYAVDTERPDWFDEEDGGEFDPFKRAWEQMKSRRLIQMEYLGQRVSPYFVQSTLAKEIEDQKIWLDEQDRRLYEDIVVNSVGVILRRRIQRAEKWVQEMDKIMRSRDSSSGLTFSIAWKPLTAETEEELDTKDLVKLLQRNSKFLSEEDLNKITKHFQSKIERAKELIQLRSEGATLHQVLKEVLDYRKWFAFVLSYQRVNEPKRELTNTAFFKFSGGEKAMAMYIPLFTAAYSRYGEAGKMSPYIISLDEAFAGVDENNIRDMFEVVEQLGFNYIMNSQALWGDYDTISSLSICELVRPKNADYVTVIRYHWNGRERMLVTEATETSDSQVKESHAAQPELVSHE